MWAGWFVGTAAGQQANWRPVSPRPLAIARSEGALLNGPGGVSIGRPQPLEPPREADSGPPEPGVIPTAFRTSGDGPRPVLRAKLLDDDTSAPSGEPAAPKGEADLPEAPVPVDPPPGATTETLKELPAPAPSPSALAGEKEKGKEPAPGPQPGPAPRPVGPLEPTTPFAIEGSGCGPVQDGTRVADGSGWGQDGGAPNSRFYASAEYLLWWFKGFNTPPLVTTSPATVPQAMQGVLGEPTTAVLFGGSQLTQDAFSGVRLRAGYAFGPCNLWAVEGSYFVLQQQNVRFSTSSAANPVIARPFIANDAQLGQFESAELVSSPGSAPGDLFSSIGSIRVDAPTQLWGAEVNLRRTICCGCDYKIDVLGGYRYLNLSDGLHITEDLTALRAVPSAGINVGDHIIVTDRFDTRNQFNGGQMGIAGEWRYGRLVLGGSVKLALGNMHETMDIHGSTSITSATPGVPTRQFGSGLLALSSNSGTFSRDQFAVVPEVGLQVGFQLTDHLRAFVGYNFLYINNVVRPGDQIDRVLNTNLIPPFTPNAPAGPARPIVPFKTTDFWAQGVNLGLEFRY
jgi:hypothetical protein